MVNRKSFVILQLGVVVQFVVSVIGLLGASFMIDFLLSTNAVLPARFYGSEQEYRLYNITANRLFPIEFILFDAVTFLTGLQTLNIIRFQVF